MYLSGAMVVDSTELLLAALAGHGWSGGGEGRGVRTLFLMPSSFQAFEARGVCVTYKIQRFVL